MILAFVEWIDYGQAGGLHLRCHTASLCGELGLPAQAMQHPVVVETCRGVINVPADALGLCKVKGCAPHRSDCSGRDAILRCGNVVVPAYPQQNTYLASCVLLHSALVNALSDKCNDPCSADNVLPCNSHAGQSCTRTCLLINLSEAVGACPRHASLETVDCHCTHLATTRS